LTKKQVLTKVLDDNPKSYKNLTLCSFEGANKKFVEKLIKSSDASSTRKANIAKPPWGHISPREKFIWLGEVCPHVNGAQM
jgi:hypothetical protein